MVCFLFFVFCFFIIFFVCLFVVVCSMSVDPLMSGAAPRGRL